MKTLGLNVVLVLAMIVTAYGQDRQNQRQPVSKPADVQSPSDQSRLPTIDLPEFVITGIATIDPPDVEKNRTEESGVYKRHPSENLPGLRDQATVDIGERFKQSLFATGEVRDGLLMASMGTYFSPMLMASYGISTSDHGILGEAGYSRTRGFARFTDASRGFLAADGSLVLRSPGTIFDEARLSGGGSVEIRKYKFYGSTTPSVQREWSAVEVGLRAASGVGAPQNYHGGLEYRSLSLTDSSATVTENHVTISGGSGVSVLDVPLEVDASVDLSTITAATPVSLSLFRLSLTSMPFRWKDLSLVVALNGFAVSGMGGQRGNYVYPAVRMRYAGLPSHDVYVGFYPAVAFVALRGQSARAPYLSAVSVIRHPVDRLALSGGVESSWSESIQTKIHVEYQKATDVALYDDGADTGIGTFRYGGTTSILSARMDAVANITPIDYFAVAVTARSSRN
ncbi:MAG: hypothetical protein HY563_09430, partial [Ignavibacteriales bacterium]|nr:hypothetical protein [Ignavibacteriales bacterium]